MAKLKEIFKNKTVLITGHTGFKGSWLSLWLNNLGARVVGISDGIPSSPSNFEVSSIENLVESHFFDICEKERLSELINDVNPDFIFHLAAQALVRNSYKYPRETFLTNAIGTANILDSLKDFDERVNLILITSDKAYDNIEQVWGYKETDALGGKDPYSASKGMAELAIKSYYHSYFNDSQSQVRLAIARAGNVIGGGDWALDRIVVDCMKSWSVNKKVDIRNPKATRPWQHVLEPLSGYLTLALELESSKKLNGEAYNFGPPADQNYSVENLIEEMKVSWDNVSWRDVSSDSSKVSEAGLLKLNCDKALSELKWLPTMDFSETVSMTVDWYKTFYESSKNNMREFSCNQIDTYTNLALERKRIWTI